jgi:nucleotide-binding universal stress UspA family protein
MSSEEISGRYLVVIDSTPEAEIALRYAARLAHKTGMQVEILSVIGKQDFVAWGAVQATMEAEALDLADEAIKRAMETIGEEGIPLPHVTIRQGDTVQVIRQLLTESTDFKALILGAAAAGAPGALVTQFTGQDAGALPCALMIIPGGLEI